MSANCKDSGETAPMHRLVAYVISAIFLYAVSNCINVTLNKLGSIFSRRHFEIFLLFFPENRL